MSIPKCLEFSDYNKYPADDNPTTNAQMQVYMDNQNKLTKELAFMLWQPQTIYVAGQVVRSSSMPTGCQAMVTVAGQSGVTEPNWTGANTLVVDSGVTYKMIKSITDVTITGNGNAVTNVTSTNGALTITKGATFLTEHQDISGKADLTGATFTGSIATTNNIVVESSKNFTQYPNENKNVVEVKDTNNQNVGSINIYSKTGTQGADADWDGYDGYKEIKLILNHKAYNIPSSGESDAYQVSSAIGVRDNGYGTYAYVDCTNIPTSDNSNKIATTSFVHSLLNESSGSGDSGGGGSAVQLVCATCSTNAATNAKVATLAGFTLTTNATIAIYFSNGGTSSSPTLNVNGTGAKALWYGDTRRFSSGVYIARYNGTRWDLWSMLKGSSDSGSGGS